MPPLSSESLAPVKRFAFAMHLAFCSNEQMSPELHLLSRLAALRDKHTLDVVADKAACSAEYLEQILKGVKLQGSKNPRGIGPSVRKKLDAAYPGWADIPDDLLTPRDELEESVIREIRRLRPGSTFRNAAFGALQGIVSAAPLGELLTQTESSTNNSQLAA